MVLLLQRALVSRSLAMDELGGREDLCDSDHRSIIPYVHGRMVLYYSSLISSIYVSLSLSFFSDSLKWCLLEPFIAQSRTITTSFKARQVASGQVKLYAVRPHRSGVANDVFNGVGTPDLIVCLTALSQ
jgi:hypothetical protein